MAVLFLVLAVGYAANKLKIMTGESNKLLTKLVINIAMPCTILNSVISGDVGITGGQALFFVLMIILTFIIAFLLVIPIPRLLNTPKEDTGIYQFMVVFGNVGFMGFPVVQSIFGTASIFYVALFNIPFTILSFSLGIIMVAGRGEKINPKLFINPALIGAAVAIFIFATKITVPSILSSTTEIIGQLTTPAAMLIIGSTLASIPIKEVFSQWRLYPISLLKLFIVPVITWLVLRLFITDELMLGVLVVLSAMPTATNATMLSMEYGGNEKLASKGVFITTLLSVATIPLLVYLLLT